MDFRVAIPSIQRADTIKEKTEDTPAIPENNN